MQNIKGNFREKRKSIDNFYREMIKRVCGLSMSAQREKEFKQVVQCWAIHLNYVWLQHNEIKA